MRCHLVFEEPGALDIRYNATVVPAPRPSQLGDHAGAVRLH